MSFRSDWSAYSDTCLTKLSSGVDVLKLDIGDAYTLSDGNTAYKGVMKAVISSETKYTSTYVNSANSSSLCGKTDWAINTTKDITGLTCDDEAKDSAGDVSYVLFYLDGSSLKITNSSTAYPTSVGSTVYTKQ